MTLQKTERKKSRIKYAIVFVELLVVEVLIGSVFDVKDIMRYAVGCVILGTYELIKIKKN